MYKINKLEKSVYKSFSDKINDLLKQLKLKQLWKIEYSFGYIDI